MGWIKNKLPESRAETQEKRQEMLVRLERCQEQLAGLEQGRDRFTEKISALELRLEQYMETQREWIAAALEEHRKWEEAALAAVSREQAAAQEAHRAWEEAAITAQSLGFDSSLESQRKWQEAALRTFGEEQAAAREVHRAWEEAAITAQSLGFDSSLESQRKWQEAALAGVQTWFSRAIKGEKASLTQSQDQVKSMLESLWKAERGALPNGNALPAVLEQKAYMDQTERAVEASLAQLRRFAETVTKPLVVFAGSYVIFDMGTCGFIRRFAKQFVNYHTLLLSNVTWFSEAETAGKIDVPFSIVPQAIGARYLFETLEIPSNREVNNLFSAVPVLEDALAKARVHNPKITDSFARYIIATAFNYYSRAFEILHPDRVVTCNPYYYHHEIIDLAAKRLDIRTSYMSAANFPGTIFWDDYGEIGACLPAKEYLHFSRLPCSEEELQQAVKIKQYLFTSKLNHYQQAMDEQGALLLKTLKEREKPLVLFLGTLDVESGIYPYTEDSERDLLPGFSSCDSVALYLSGIAKKNNWELIYKLHPRAECRVTLPQHIHLVGKGDINEYIKAADVIVAVYTSAVYTALVQDKPLVMLGYTALRGRGCVYEAYTRSEVEGAIKKALAEGMTEEMKQKFILHIAQMNKYYLYDDNQPRELRYGRKIEELDLNFKPEELPPRAETDTESGKI